MKDQLKIDSVYFIADLHLSHKHPQITKRFQSFLQHKARHARALYILGDLFEYWLGDDAALADPLANTVADGLSQLAQEGAKIYYMHGNRDFLIGEEYAERSRFEILPDPTIHDIFGQSWLLTHGDALCTDDHAYQQVRSMVRQPEWQQDFLQKSIDERIAFAEQARQQSSAHTQNADDSIMDVNADAVKDMFAQHDQSLCIHGHTHRPAVHQSDENTRIVVGDWHHNSSYLQLNQSGYKLVHGDTNEQ